MTGYSGTAGSSPGTSIGCMLLKETSAVQETRRVGVRARSLFCKDNKLIIGSCTGVLGLDAVRVEKHHGKPGDTLARLCRPLSTPAILSLCCMHRLSWAHAGASFLQCSHLQV